MVSLLAGSLHVGRFQPALVQFVAGHRDLIATKPSAFLSVSLSAAGENPDDWEGLEQCVARFIHETGWTPDEIHHAAGAIKYSQYDFFKRLALKHIAMRRGHATRMNHDYDFTDYEALNRFILDFVERVAGEGAAARRSGETGPSGLGDSPTAS